MLPMNQNNFYLWVMSFVFTTIIGTAIVAAGVVAWLLAKGLGW